MDFTPKPSALHFPFDAVAALKAIYGDLAVGLLFGQGLSDMIGSGGAGLDPSAQHDFALWAGGIWDHEVGGRPKIGAYFMPGLHDVTLIRSIDPDERRLVREWGKRLGAGTVAAHVCVFAESEHGSAEEQLARLAAIEAKTGLRFSVVVYSGATDSEIITLADVNPEWVRAGKSIHVYLVLDRLLMVGKVKADEEKWLKAMRLLCVVFRGDPAIVDVARKMRLPGVVARMPGHHVMDGVRLQALARPPVRVTYTLAEIIDRLIVYLASEGVPDPEAAYRTLQVATRLDQRASKEQDAQKKQKAQTLAARLWANRKAEEADEQEATELLGAAGRTDSASGSPAARGVIDPDTLVELADGRKVRVRDAKAAGAVPGGKTVSCFCPNHTNTNSPAATLCLTEGGVPFVKCWSTCSMAFFAIEPVDGLEGVDVVDLPYRDQESTASTQVTELSPSPVPTPAETTGTGKVRVQKSIEVDVRYLSDAQALNWPFIQQFKVVHIRSPKNTGKTEWMRKVIASMPPKSRVLFLVHRQTLAWQVEGRLKGLGLTNYLTVKGPLGQQGIIVCLDSLRRVDVCDSDGTPKPFDLVVVDEAEQAFEHLDGGTIDSVETVADKLGVIVRDCHTLVCMDADLDRTTVQAVRLLREGDEAGELLVRNVHQLPVDVTLYSTSAELDRVVFDWWAASERLAVYCATKREAERVARQLRDSRLGSKVVCITSKNSADYKATILDINGWLTREKPDALVYSPSLGTGVSIDAADYFDHRVAYVAVGLWTTPEDAAQGCLRCRTPRDPIVHAWVGDNTVPGEYRAEAIRRDILLNRSGEERIVLRHIKGSDGKYSPVALDPLALDLVVLVRSRRASRQRNFKARFADRFSADGGTVTNVEPDPLGADGLKAASKVAREAVAAEDAAEVAAAQDISWSDAKLLAREPGAGAAEKAMVRKARIRHVLGLDELGESVTPGLVREAEGGLLDAANLMADVRAFQQGGDARDALVQRARARHQRDGVRWRPSTLAAGVTAKVLALYAMPAFDAVVAGPLIVLPVPDAETLDKVRKLSSMVRSALNLRVPEDLSSRPFRFLSDVLRRLGLSGRTLQRRTRVHDAAGNTISRTAVTIGYRVLADDILKVRKYSEARLQRLVGPPLNDTHDRADSEALERLIDGLDVPLPLATATALEGKAEVEPA